MLAVLSRVNENNVELLYTATDLQIEPFVLRLVREVEFIRISIRYSRFKAQDSETVLQCWYAFVLLLKV